MNITIEITGADIAENPNRITNPDYPIIFSSDEFGKKSVHEIAQRCGKKMWFDMHGEMPDHVYYTSK